MLALVTCREAADVDSDLPLLQAELPNAAIVSWDDPSVDWSDFRAVVLRSAWDYHRRLEQFRTWAAHVSVVSHLWNPLSMIEWNLDKRYLAELDRWGIPVVPTTYLHDVGATERLAARRGFDGDLVVKPSVGASASGVLVTHGDASAALAHASALLEAGLTPMVQPYLADAADDGETGLVYFRGEFSHAFRRRVVVREGAELDGDVFGDERSEAHQASPAECAVGDAVVARLADAVYARVDLLPTAKGPVVLEAELIEPSLFLHLDAGASARAAAVFRSLIE